MSALPPHQPPAGTPWTFRQLARRRADGEYCDLCGREIPADHQHLFEPAQRRLTCACDACAILFDSIPSRADNRKYRRVPREVRRLPGFRLTDAQWDSLCIPIDLAFFSESTVTGHVVALYPSPAGPTESLLRLETWQDLVRDNPPLAQMQPDVEALLVNRIGVARSTEPAEYFILPIDECFRLTGLMRLHWKGLSGGTEVWRAIGAFFDDLRGRAHV